MIREFESALYINRKQIETRLNVSRSGPGAHVLTEENHAEVGCQTWIKDGWIMRSLECIQIFPSIPPTPGHPPGHEGRDWVSSARSISRFRRFQVPTL